jgi:hypothetical protein
MYSRTLKRRVTNFEAAQKDASGTRSGPERLFVRICGQISGGRKWKCKKTKEMTGDGVSERSEEKIEFRAVATPL